jgi:hypothetical protein
MLTPNETDVNELDECSFRISTSEIHFTKNMFESWIGTIFLNVGTNRFAMFNVANVASSTVYGGARM